MDNFIRLAFALVFLFQTAPIQARTFTDDQGREIEAEVLSVEGPNVSIRSAGKDYTLPITRFSESDQDYIRKWVSDRAASSFKLRIFPAGSAPPSGDGGKAKAPAPSDPEARPPASPTAGVVGELKPGATLKFSFPGLAKDFSGNEAAFSVKLPADYDPEKPVPLFIFLGGGKGNSSPGGAIGCTNGDFVCAGLPYPTDGRNPRQRNMVGNFDRVWAYWKPMLAKLAETIPNLDPDVRVIGGFSNGAHAIDGLLSNPEFSASFAAFLLVDGGGVLGQEYQGVRDKHLYYAWGEKSPVARISRVVQGRANRGQMKLRATEMKGVGHQFPGTQKPDVKKWLYETVIPDLRKG